MDFIFGVPYSYLQPSYAEIRLELDCLWQLNLTGGNRHDGKGLLSQNVLCTCSFPWQAFFSFLKMHVNTEEMLFFPPLQRPSCQLQLTLEF